VHYQFEVYFIDSSKMMGDFPEVLNSTGYFATGSSVSSGQFSPFILQMLGFNGWTSVAWNAASAYKDSDFGVLERILRRESLGISSKSALDFRAFYT
jgi:hypothetical protein